MASLLGLYSKPVNGHRLGVPEAQLVNMLQAHSEKSKQDLTAYEQFKDPQTVTVTTLTPNRKEIGKAFKKDGKVLACPIHSCMTQI